MQRKIPTPVIIMKTRKTAEAQSPEDLCNDLRSLVADAEKILAGSTTEINGSDDSVTLRERMAEARDRITGYYDTARRNVVAGAKFTDRSIRTNPYQSVAIAVGAGVLIGLLLGRRRE